MASRRKRRCAVIIPPLPKVRRIIRTLGKPFPFTREHIGRGVPVPAHRTPNRT